MSNEVDVNKLAEFLQQSGDCAITKEFASTSLTLKQYVSLLAKESNILLLEKFTCAWCQNHPEDKDIWVAFIYHFRRVCEPCYYFLHVKKYRELGMCNDRWL
jgi:hypothetical protein